MLRDLSREEPSNVEYSDFERALLSAGRTETPDPALEARMLAPFGGAAGPLDVGAPAGESGSPSLWARLRPPGLRASHLFGGGALGTAAVALGLFLGRSETPPTVEPHPSTTASVEASPAVSRTVQRDPSTSGPEAAAAPPGREESAMKARAARIASRSREAKSDRGDSLGEELRLLDAARSALARGERGAAHRLLERYEARFPNGQLRSEARVLARRLGGAPRSE